MHKELKGIFVGLRVVTIGQFKTGYSGWTLFCKSLLLIGGYSQVLRVLTEQCAAAVFLLSRRF